jgi:integrase/recombinase XerD
LKGSIRQAYGLIVGDGKRRLSLRDYVKNYLSFLQVEKGLTRNSLINYSNDLRHLENHASVIGKPLSDIVKVELVRWLRHQSQQGLSSGTIARRISSVRGFYKYLQLDGVIKQSPAEELVPPRLVKHLPQYLSEDEVVKLIKAVSTDTPEGIRDYAMLELLYATGLRVSELVNLSTGDIDLVRSLLKCSGKGNKQRLIPIGRDAVQALRRYLGMRLLLCNGQSSSYLFVKGGGKSLTRQDVWKILKRCAEKTGIKNVNPHSWRHSFATHLTQRGADSRTVQALLGHSDLSTTQIYTHLSKSNLRETLDAFHPRIKVET